MRFGFSDQRLRELCNSQSRLFAKFGRERAQEVIRTLWSLDAAPTLNDLSTSPPISRRAINGMNPPMYSAGSINQAKIFFLPDPQEIPKRLSDVKAITITRIGGTS